MKIFALINDGYQVIYHKDLSIINDWKYIYQEHFAILRVFELEVPEEKILDNFDLLMNYGFDKRLMAQSLYENEAAEKNYTIKIKNKMAYLDELCEDQDNIVLELSEDEKIIISATRKYIKEKSKNYGNY